MLLDEQVRIAGPRLGVTVGHRIELQLLVGSLTGLTRGRFPIHAKATHAGQLTSALSLIWAVLELSSRGWRGVS